MKTRIKAVLVILAVGSALAAPFGAVAGGCGGTVIEAGVLDGSGGVRFYVDDRGEDGIWVYSESNGRGGLQRGGTHPVLNYPDECVDDPSVPADTLLF